MKDARLFEVENGKGESEVVAETLGDGVGSVRVKVLTIRLRLMPVVTMTTIMIVVGLKHDAGRYASLDFE